LEDFKRERRKEGEVQERWTTEERKLVVIVSKIKGYEEYKNNLGDDMLCEIHYECKLEVLLVTNRYSSKE